MAPSKAKGSLEIQKLGSLAVTLIASMLTSAATAMDVSIVKDKAGKEYFCANAKCAGLSDCAGAGNASCANLNKCAKSEQKHLSGWLGADDKAMCEKAGKGKWLLFKKEYSLKHGNKAPLSEGSPIVPKM